MSSKDRKWEMQALSRLLSLKTYLFNKLEFDYVILDTSPGLRYSSINAILVSDVSFLVTTLERSDIKGTQIMLKDLYNRFEKNATEVILNKVPLDFSNSKNSGVLPVFLEKPVKITIPCFCDLKSDGDFFFAIKYPDHDFSKTLQKIAEKID